MIMTRKVRANKRSRRGGISLLWDFQVSGGPRSRRGGGYSPMSPSWVSPGSGGRRSRRANGKGGGHCLMRL